MGEFIATVSTACLPCSSQQSHMRTLELWVVLVPLVSCGTVVKKIHTFFQMILFKSKINKKCTITLYENS